MRRIVTCLALFVLGLIASLAIGLWRSLPRAEEESAVLGISSSVELEIDAWGIPHIYAQTDADAYFGLGYAHARDRLWQLEQNRRAASGTLAEVLGERALASDRLFRVLGLRRAAEANWRSLPEDARDALNAYTRGINAWLAGDHALPPEFVVCRCEPAEWQPVDSLAFLGLMAYQLSGNWGEELRRVRLSGVLRPSQLAEFEPPHAGDEAIEPDVLIGVYRRLGFAFEHDARSHAAAATTPARLAAAESIGLSDFAPSFARLQALAPTLLGDALGSNNWVVSGSKTLSGRPLLANDPHLALRAPSQWYLAHLEAPGLRVIGATLPALPGVIVGHNTRVAWGFTNMGPDVQDLYIEKLGPRGEAEYLTVEGPRAFETRREIIQVRGEDPVELEVRVTRHGPVISDASAEARELLPPGYVISLAYAGSFEGDPTLSFPIAAARAQNAAQFLEAARRFQSPPQNIVYADVDGSIGYVAAGRVPLRRADNDLRGLMPAPGWLSAYDWSGFVPFEELPRQTQPDSGRIVTANQNVAAPPYPHWLGADWAPPYRARRIEALLDARDGHTIESFAAIQTDLHSSIADQLLPVLLRILPPSLDVEEQALVDALRAWDHQMLPGLREPLVFAAWLRELEQRLYRDELAELFGDERQARPEFVHDVLTDRAGRARWCDDQGTPAPEACPEITRDALRDALGYLKRRFGADPSRWTWGEAHPSRSAHPLLGALPVVGRWFDVRARRGGDSSSVNVGSYSTDDDDTAFSNAWGPGFRAIYDVGALDRSLAVLNTGQSGHVLSPHYADQNPLWSTGRYIPLTTERRALEEDVHRKLVLLPR
jgi:penicillin amidase